MQNIRTDQSFSKQTGLRYNHNGGFTL